MRKEVRTDSVTGRTVVLQLKGDLELFTPYLELRKERRKRRKRKK
jgi:hypothetical protein